MTRELLNRHKELTTSLTELLGEAGQVRAAITHAKADTWANNYGLPVTERKETASYSASGLTAELQDLDAQIEQLRAEMYHIGLELEYGGK